MQGIAALMLDEYKPGMEAKGIAYSYTPAALKALVQKSQGGALVRATCAAPSARRWRTPPPSA